MINDPTIDTDNRYRPKFIYGTSYGKRKEFNIVIDILKSLVVSNTYKRVILFFVHGRHIFKSPYKLLPGCPLIIGILELLHLN